jgi:hypothetical protein
MILGIDQRDAQIPFYVFIFIHSQPAHDTATNTGNQQTNPTKPVHFQPAHNMATNTE